MRDNGCSVGVSMQVKTVATVSSFEHALDDNAAKEMLKDSRLRTTKSSTLMSRTSPSSSSRMYL